jgi:hypothetical protein
MTGPQLQNRCRRVARRDTRMVYEQDITHEILFFLFWLDGCKSDRVSSRLDTDGLEDTVGEERLVLNTIMDKFRVSNPYLNPLPPVAISVPGICACQCTSLTDSI